MKINHYIIVVVLLSQFAAEAQQPSPSPSPQLTVSQAKELIASGNDNEHLACSSLEKAFENADAQEKESLKAELAPWIMGLINAPVQANEEWTDLRTPRSHACYLAGVFKIESAIPSLVQLLSPLRGQRRDTFLRNIPSERVSMDTTAIYALVQIGKPAEAPLRAALKAINDGWPTYYEWYRNKKGHTSQENEDFSNTVNKRDLIEHILKKISPEEQSD